MSIGNQPTQVNFSASMPGALVRFADSGTVLAEGKSGRGPTVDRSRSYKDFKIETSKEDGTIRLLRAWLHRKRKAQKRKFEDGIGHPFPRVRGLVRAKWFENTITVIILINCFFVGLEALVDEQLFFMELGEQFFTFAFSVDLLLRVLGHGWTWLLAKENWVDIGLVVSSVFTVWILVPMGASVGTMRKVSMFRALRMVRIARLVKNRPEMKEMWRLLKGLVDSTGTLLWTMFMIGILLYFFGILATSLIARQDSFAENERVQELFGNVFESMLTLFQFMTLDSWSSIVRDLMKNQAWIAWASITFITVGKFALMNLITAVIIENAFADSRTEEAELATRQAQTLAEELDHLTAIFMELDGDRSGKLSREEMVLTASSRKVRLLLKNLGMTSKEMLQLWEILDYSEGELNVDEFIGGMKQLRGEATSKDILKLYRDLRIMEGSINGITSEMDGTQEKMVTVKFQLKRTKQDIASLIRTLQRTKETLQSAASSQPLS